MIYVKVAEKLVSLIAFHLVCCFIYKVVLELLAAGSRARCLCLGAGEAGGSRGQEAGGGGVSWQGLRW